MFQRDGSSNSRNADELEAKTISANKNEAGSSDDSRDYEMETEYSDSKSNNMLNFLKKKTIRNANIILLKQPNDEKEVFQNMRVEVNENSEISIRDIVEKLKYMGFPINRAMIFYFDIGTNCYVYTGNDPLKNDTFIPFNSRTNEIKLKYRTTHQSFLYEEEKSNRMKVNKNCERENNNKNQRFLNDREKRVKERYIKDVLEKVELWRRLNNGMEDEFGNFVQLNLEMAAAKINISKKTLDDYLFQIRMGQRFGFDFDRNINEKIGVLRKFVKKKREEAKRKKNDFEMEIEEEIIPQKEYNINESEIIREQNDNYDDWFFAKQNDFNLNNDHNSSFNFDEDINFQHNFDD